MTATIFALSILFPVLTREQLWLEKTVEHKTFLQIASGQIEELDWNFYADSKWLNVENSDSSLKDGDLSFLDEEDVPLPDGLENPEYGPQSENSDFVNGVREESVAELQYKNSLQRLVLFEYGEEQLALSAMPLGNAVVSVNGKTVKRISYDGSLRPKVKLVLKNGTSVSDSKLISRTTYMYSEENEKSSDENDPSDGGKILPPLYKNPSSTLEEYYEENKVIETFYTESGFPQKVSFYSIEKKDDETEHKYLTKTTERKYDEQNRIVLEEERLYKDEKVYSEKQNEYIYTEISNVPDYKFYENGKLRLTDVYLDEGVYEETVYFDNEYSVRVKYEHGRKTKEVISLGNKELSRRNFD